MNSEDKNQSPIQDYDLEKSKFPLAEAFISNVYNDVLRTSDLLHGENKAFLLSKSWNKKASVTPFVEILESDEMTSDENDEFNQKNIQESIQETKLSDPPVVEEELPNLPQNQVELNVGSDEGLNIKVDGQKGKTKQTKKSLVKVEKSKIEKIAKKDKPIGTKKDKPIGTKKDTPNRSYNGKKQKSDKKFKTKAPKLPLVVETAQAPKASKKLRRLSQAPDFYSWLEYIDQGNSWKVTPEESKPKKKTKKDQTGDSILLKTKKSQELKNEIASETLAALLVSQGHKAKAIKMYEKLIRKNPEKTSIFAAHIEKLKI
ncbi:MAG: hypothetical protein IPM48_06195 [Saprospiraceae bacterium]|nr:hypothetical protein [Saprospiraceae bacterium]